jgi:DNA-binding transcriptional ArsR family regulator
MTGDSTACESTAEPPESTAEPRESAGASRERAERVADLFKVLGDPTRVLILQALIGADELCVHELAAAVNMSPSAVSHHLRILRHFDLIRYRRDGREVYYRPHDEHVEQLIAVCSEHILHSREMMLGGADHD